MMSHEGVLLYAMCTGETWDEAAVGKSDHKIDIYVA